MTATLLAAGGLFDVEGLLEKGGLALLLAIIFAESGLLIGFFLPGDSLLFIAGFLASDAGGEKLPGLLVLLPLLFLAAFLGDQVGYIFGSKVGPSLFHRPDSRLFKQEYLTKTSAFFEKHGPKTIVLARFVPIVRTFAPILAGVGNMTYRTFVTFNALGALLWACGITVLGFFLGEIEFVTENIELAIIGIIGLSLLPVAIEFLRHRSAARRDASHDPAEVPELG